MDFSSVFVWIMQGVAGMLITVLWSIIRDLKGKVEKLDDELAAHKIEAAAKYLTRDEMKSVIDTVNQALERYADKLESRLDRLERHILESRGGN